MSQQEGRNQNTLSIAVLLRLAADGELDAQQEARLRAHLDAHPEDQQRIEFEHQLRKACSRACAPDCDAPNSLHARIRERCCETAEPDFFAEGLAARAVHTRKQNYWVWRTATRIGTAAALIALVAAVAFLVGRTGSIGPFNTNSTGEVISASMAERVATFVRGEHNRCADMPMEGATKFTVHEISSVPAEYASLVGQKVTLANILQAAEHGLTFVDAGECHLPTGTALHIRFRTADPDAGLVSLWVQPDDNQLEIQDGVTYLCGQGCDCVRFWRAEGVRYVLVSPNPQTIPIAGEALHCPEKSTQFE